MRAERSFAVMALGFLLLSCAGSSEVSSDRGSAAAVATPRSEQSMPEGRQASDTAGTSAPKSARPPGSPPAKVIAALLREAGEVSGASRAIARGSISNPPRTSCRGTDLRDCRARQFRVDRPAD